MRNIKQLSTSLLSLLSTNVINIMPCVSSNGTRLAEIETRLDEIKDTVSNTKKRLVLLLWV